MRTLKSKLSAELKPAPALNAPVCASFTSTTTFMRSSVGGLLRVVMFTSWKKPRRCSASRLLRSLVAENSSCSWRRISRRIDLVARLGVAGDLDAVDRHRAAALDLEGDVDQLVLGIDVGLGLDVGEGVAVLREPLGQLLHVVAQRAGAGRPRPASVARSCGSALCCRAGSVLAGDRHLADLELIALVDLDGRRARPSSRRSTFGSSTRTVT